jgi:fructose/tagatose bisphosphate aldolase
MLKRACKYSFSFCLYGTIKINVSSELQLQNDETLNKLYDNQDRIDASREWLLEDKAGIAPRMFHFDMNSVRHLIE